MSECVAVDGEDVWQWLNPLPTGNAVNGVAFLNGRFVVCSGAQVSTSTDGSNWVTQLVSGEPSLSRAAFGNGLYVAVGVKTGTGAIATTSTNLTDWTLQSAQTTNALQAVVYGNKLFVATGDGGTIVTSTNGSDWVSRSSGTTGSLRSIAYGNGIYVAVSGDVQGDSSASVSPDGILWTRQVVGGTSISCVTYARGNFYAGGELDHPSPPYYTTTLYMSANGTNWSQAALSGDAPGIRTVFADANSVFAEDGSLASAGLLKSSDGTNFSRVTTTGFVAANAANGYVYGNGVFVGAGSLIQISSDAASWSTVSGPTPILTDVACGNGLCVAVGGGFALPSGSGSVGSGSVLAASGLFPFKVQSSPVTSLLSRVLFANGIFLCVGYSGTILWSTNGTQWVQRNSATGNNLRSLCYGNGSWVAVGDSGAVVTSPNGLAWTLRTSGTASALNGVTCASNMFVAVGAQGSVITSPNATDWTVQFADTQDTFFDITYGSGLFVAVGENGALWTSPDGVNWTASNSGTTSRLHAVAFASGSFVAVGCPDDYSNLNVLLVATNGSAWTAHNPGTAFRLYGARPINEAFILVGDHGTILQNPSPDSIQLGGEWNAVAEQFEVAIGRGLGLYLRVQSSDSIAPTLWRDRVTFTNAASLVKFADPSSSPSQPMRFYRVAAQ